MIYLINLEIFKKTFKNQRWISFVKNLKKLFWKDFSKKFGIKKKEKIKNYQSKL